MQVLFGVLKGVSEINISIAKFATRQLFGTVVYTLCHTCEKRKGMRAGWRSQSIMMTNLGLLPFYSCS